MSVQHITNQSSYSHQTTPFHVSYSLQPASRIRATSFHFSDSHHNHLKPLLGFIFKPKPYITRIHFNSARSMSILVFMAIPSQTIPRIQYTSRHIISRIHTNTLHNTPTSSLGFSPLHLHTTPRIHIISTRFTTRIHFASIHPTSHHEFEPDRSMSLHASVIVNEYLP